MCHSNVLGKDQKLAYRSGHEMVVAYLLWNVGWRVMWNYVESYKPDTEGCALCHKWWTHILGRCLMCVHGYVLYIPI